MKKDKKSFFNHGFTLIELLVVISIVAILSTIIYSSVSDARVKARNTQRVANINQIEVAIALYQNDHGGTPPGEDGVEYVNGNKKWIPDLVPEYIPELPSDPIDKNGNKFHYTKNGKNYEVIAFMEKHGNDASCGDGGHSCQYYEKGSGEFLVIANPGASGWRFESTTEIIEAEEDSTLDPTPRIMYWYGKVNQHVDSQGVWQSDPDGVSGANLHMLTYCKKWYPNTTDIREYKSETIDTWRRAINFEQSGYTSTKVSYECVVNEDLGSQEEDSTLDPTPRIMYWWGKVNQHVDSQGVWQSDPDGVSGANLNMLTYCKKWYPNTTDTREYKSETIDTWRRAIYFEQSGYTSTKTSYECVVSN